MLGVWVLGVGCVGVRCWYALTSCSYVPVYPLFLLLRVSVLMYKAVCGLGIEQNCCQLLGYILAALIGE